VGAPPFQAGYDVAGIEWLRQEVPVDKETSVLTNEAEAIAAANGRAHFLAKRHCAQEPDSFCLTDATGISVLSLLPSLGLQRM
jgi:hypothetical protein